MCDPSISSNRRYWKQKWRDIPLSCVEFPVQTVRMNRSMQPDFGDWMWNSIHQRKKPQVKKPTPPSFLDNCDARAFREAMALGPDDNQDVIMRICRASDCTPEAINLYLMRRALGRANDVFRPEDPRNLLQRMLPPQVPFTGHRPPGSGNEAFSRCMQSPQVQQQMQLQGQIMAAHMKQTRRGTYFLPPKWLKDYENLYRRVASNLKPLEMPEKRRKKPKRIRDSSVYEKSVVPTKQWINLARRDSSVLNSKIFAASVQHEEIEVQRPIIPKKLEQPGRHYYGGGTHRIEFLAPHRLSLLGSQILVRVGKKPPPAPPPPPPPLTGSEFERLSVH